MSSNAGQGQTTEVGTNASPRDVARAAKWVLTWAFPRTSSVLIDPRPPWPASGAQPGAAGTTAAVGPTDAADTTDTTDLLIGRDPTAAVHLDTSDVSRRHAVLRRREGSPGVRLVDLGSRNGVHVNGQRVAEADLRIGDVVRIGGSVGVVTDGESVFEELAPGLFGGARLAAALAPLRKAASSDLPVVLEGETGTGKEVVSRSVHAWSHRAGPLVAVNCAALPEGLAEAELFGYRKGAFTGADRSSPGFFRRADGGTLLLDEVTDLPLGVQAKLLRALEEREVQPLGEPRPVPVDVRVIVAGQLSLTEAVRQGRFRADLLARLDGVTARLPPLRARKEDVLPLFSQLLGDFSEGTVPALEPALVERLLIHDWPFNVRELVLVVRRLLVLHGGESSLGAAHLPERIGADPTPERAMAAAAPATTASTAAAPSATPSAPSAASSSIGPSSASPASAGADRPFGAGFASGEPVELRALLAALRASAGNVARAATLLGITRQRAYRLMEGHDVDLAALRRPSGDRG